MPSAVERVSAAARGAPGRLKRLLAGGFHAPVILMYHRIAVSAFDPWGLRVAPERFADQLSHLKRARTLLPMDELVAALEARRVPPRATALTFDDGYRDNALIAKPMLEAAQVPATFFLTSGAIGRGPFWWDTLVQRVLGCRSAVSFSFDHGGIHFAGSWAAQPYPASAGGLALAAREATCRQLGALIEPLSPATRDAVLTKLFQHLPASETPELESGDLPVTTAMARELPSELITVGSHGRSHAPLPSLGRDEQLAEVAGGRADLAEFTGGRQPTGFAYPHGAWDNPSRAMVARAGYHWAVTTRYALINPRRYDALALPRLGVQNWSGGKLLRTIASLGW